MKKLALALLYSLSSEDSQAPSSIAINPYPANVENRVSS